ncbi:MAG TPA: hypothetical protein DHV36_23800 [Desulfobacteraceae bacterium]|nr:hypothetical protein [Desulfobacteraceae bacterium]
MRFKPILPYLLVIILIAAAVIQSLFIGLPIIAETFIKDRFPDLPQGFFTEFSIEKIGPSRTVLHDIRIGKDVRADRIICDYSWGGPHRFQLDKITVSGLTTRIQITDEASVIVNGQTFPRKQTLSEAKKDSAPVFPFRLDLSPFFSFIPDRIVLEHINTEIIYQGQPILLPARFNIRVSREEGRAGVQGEIIPFGQRISMEAGGSLESGMTRLQISADDFTPGFITEFVQKIPEDILFGGPVNFSVTKSSDAPWQFSLEGLEIIGKDSPGVQVHKVSGHIDERAEGPPLNLTIKALADVTLSDRGLTPLPLNFSLNATVPGAGELPEFTLTGRNTPMTHFTVDRGLPSPLTLLSPELEFSVKGTTADQKADVRLRTKGIDHHFPLGSASSGTLEFKAETQGDFLNPATEKPITFSATLSELASKILLVSNRIKRVNAQGQIRIKTDNLQEGLLLVSGHILTLATGIEARQTGSKVDISALRMKANLRPGAAHNRLSVGMDCVLSNILALFDGNRINVEKNRISGTVHLGLNQPPDLRLNTQITGAAIDLRAAGFNAEGINVKLPISYPYRPETKPGQLTVGRFTDGRRLNAGLEGVLRQTGDHKISMTGRATSKDIDDLVLHVDLAAGLDEALVPDVEVAVRSEAFHFTEKALSRILPDIQNQGTFNIKASTQSHAVFRKHVLTTGGSISIHEGRVNMPDLNLTVDGIRGNIIMADLLTPESLPGQKIQISTIDAGQFRFNDAKLRFSIEDGKSLNLENLTLKWCNGIVSTESLRLPDPDGRVSLTLYCDRLEMDSLLRQIGAFDADGGGTLSGRIPVVYQNGDISFENGFLFSTPGQGGRIFVNDIDRLMTGMPKDSPQVSHLDLAAEALKDFQYTWAKLRLNTTGDVLDVNMEIDGKPEKVLPFEYKREMGGFIRVDAESPGSRFQGVKLDVNLELPFNRVMKFGNKIKSILE